MYGLLDSGSVISILGNDCYNLLSTYGFPLNPDHKITVIAAGGQKIQSIGCVSLPIVFENLSHIIKAHVIPEIDSPLILGVDFWSKFNICPKYLRNVDCLAYSDALILNSSVNCNDFLYSYKNLNENEKLIANTIIKQYNNISFERKGLGRTTVVTHKINTGEAEPIKQRYYRLSPEKQRIMQQQVDEMLSLDVIEPCESPWSSPVLIVGKKDGNPRFCLDSRKLNSVTIKDAYSLPYISEILDNLREAKFLTSIDLSKAFWQIPIHEPDRDKTAFYVPGRGTFRFKVTAFGLTNAPATQQRLVDLLFGPEFELKVFAYLDDIIICSKSFSEHVLLLEKVLNKLKLANLTINLDKSNFFRSELKYLGYLIDANGLRTDPSKVEAITNYPVPKTRKEVKRFLGTASWYRRFVNGFSTIAGPLNKLTSSKRNTPPFTWSDEANSAFLELKSCLVNAPILACPDFSLPFQVHTDASNYGVGAMLAQTVDGIEHPIAYMSRSLTGPERNYSVTEREALAVLTALEHWRCYLENGKPFTVFTDHSALKWFLSLTNPTGRLARWGVRLSSFDFSIKHRRGKDNVIPDCLSRTVPISEIKIDYIKNTSDDWYLKLYEGVLNNPSSFPNYTITDEALYRFMKSNNPLVSEFEWKMVVPCELRNEILVKTHSEPTSGHFGVFKTYKRLALRYYWPGMHKDVVQFVAKCDNCAAYKLSTFGTLGKMGRPKACSRPFQTISIDLIGPLPNSKKQHCYIFAITCCFSKYCLFFPLRRATADLISRHLEDHVFLVHGIPQTIILDNGCQFISRELNKLFNKYQIPNIHFTPKYTPQINTVERYNKTLLTAISAFVNDDHRSWDVNLAKIEFAMNNSVSEITGFTPAFLVYGRELVTCGSHYVDNELVGELIFTPREKYAENLGHLSEIFGKVQTALWRSHVRNTQQYNLRRKDVEFTVGDVVWKRCYLQSDKDAYFCKKLAPKYQKCRIKEKRSPLVYVLEDMFGRSLGVWHIKDLKT